MKDPSVAMDMEIPIADRQVAPFPDRAAEALRRGARHLVGWYAFVVYAAGLGTAACLIVPTLITDAPGPHDGVCRSVTKRVVEAAAAIRRSNPMVALNTESYGPIAQRLGAMPTCPDGGHVQLVPNGMSVESESGVDTVVTSEYVAGICVRPDGTRCHRDTVMVRVNSFNTYLNTVVRPDTILPPVEVAPPKPVIKPVAKKKKKLPPKMSLAIR